MTEQEFKDVLLGSVEDNKREGILLRQKWNKNRNCALRINIQRQRRFKGERKETAFSRCKKRLYNAATVSRGCGYIYV